MAGLSDVTSWVACRSFLDSMRVGDMRVVDAHVPRGQGGNTLVW